MSDYYEVVYRKDGIFEIYLDRWQDFDFLINDMLKMSNMIYRGVNKSTYKLLPSIYRNLSPQGDKWILTKNQLDNFKHSILGRRGDNPKELEDMELWALGRHHGLKTPLLDWTQSPFVALFFAFEKKHNSSDSDARVVFALKADNIRAKISELRERRSNSGKKIAFKHFSIYEPLIDESARLINQGGLFSYYPAGIPAESWIEKNFAGCDSNDSWVLLKIRINNEGREDCLRKLNKMNINHLTLFPDLYGAAEYSNMKIEIDNY